jgi:hypothetical protein
MAKIAATLHARRGVLFEGQMRLSFVVEAAATAGITDYSLILVDCDDATRTRRLTVDRRNPDLADTTMMNWANYLRGEARELRCTILDTTRAPLDVCVERVWEELSR